MARRRTRSSRDEEEESRGDTASSTPSKRQRVSIACDSCRMAKGKCNGGRPRCGTCVIHDRNCSYTHASRKRGVPSGYLKSIEVAIGWLFEQYPGSESALHRLLTQNGGADGARILVSRDEVGGRLYRRWSKSSVYKDIGRIICDERTLERATSVDDSEPQEDISPANTLLFELRQSPHPNAQETDHSPIDPPARIDPLQSDQYSHTMPKYGRLVLPSNWNHLVDVYFAYTSCWLPIIERDSVIRTASLYPAKGLDINPSHLSPLHAQLWAVMAVASFQDAASHTSLAGSLSPNKIFSTTCDLIAANQQILEAPYISSILLQSLILLGRRNEVEAWVLIGKASRLVISAASTATPSTSTTQSSHDIPGHFSKILAAAIILDTLVSLCLGRPEMVESGRFLLPLATFTDSVNITQNWTPILGLRQAMSCNTSFLPIDAFRQLYTFTQIWVKSPGSQKTTPEDLLKSLDPKFSFCNSLLFGGLTPTVPSAFLIQAVFLTISLGLAPGRRPGLVSNLLELVELCIDTIGSFGTPPIIMTLMEIIRRSEQGERMYEEEKVRWKTAMDSLEKVWSPDSPRNNTSALGQITESGVDGNRIAGTLPIPKTADSIVVGDISEIQQTHTTQGRINFPDTRNRPPFAPSRQGDTANAAQTGISQPAPMPPRAPHSPISNEQDSSFCENPGISQQTEYNSILEELGTMDYANITDANSQFMSNLGFVPGYDLGEMFLKDFGA